MMVHRRVFCLLAVSLLAEKVLSHPPATAAAPLPPIGKLRQPHAEGGVHGRLLQDQQVLLSGVKAPVTVRLSAAIQWTPRLFRAGRARVRPEGFLCGSAGSSVMDPAVQPSCVGSICLGPMPYHTGTAFWNDVRIARPGVYTLCWCEPEVSCAGPEAGFNGQGCCFDDSDFSVNKGEILVRGPKWSSVEHPLLGEPFKVDLTGSVVSRSSRLLFRFSETEETDGSRLGGPCGGSLSSEERAASEVLVREDRRSSNNPNSANFTVRLFRRRWYMACWCAGDLHEEENLRECTTDDSFLAEIRSMLPRGPQTESVPVAYAVVGVPFALRLNGNLLGLGDRLRIIDGAKSCGTDQTYSDPAVSYFVCRGDSNCVQSAVAMRPSTLYGSPPVQTETWEPVVLTAPGLYKMCWCVDNTWDSQTLESDGFCARNVQYAVPVGTLHLEGIADQQSFYCYAFTHCTIHVSSHLAVSSNDGIFIISQQDLDMVTCGSGMQGVSILATSVNVSLDAQGQPDNTITFQFSPHVGPPGTFRVCYCQSVGMGVCNEPTVFAQRAGTLYVTAPPDGVQIALQEPPRYCLFGRPCSIGITGVWASQMHSSDAFRAVPSWFECGTAPLSVTSEIFSLAFRAPMAAGSVQASFLHASSWSKPPGDYRLCYCSLMMLPYGQSCTLPEHFATSTGVLTIFGVKGVHELRCSQGFDCNITVPGWRFAHGDRLLLLAGQSAACGVSADELQLAVGFGSNPAGSPAISAAANGDIAEFAFGMAYGAGSSRVCFCAANTSASGCEELPEFTQDVGILRVSGVITSVSLSPSHPALTSIVSLLINAEFPTWVTCAVMEEAMPNIPSLWDVVNCQETVPSCLGVARLRQRIRPGPNIIHVPITFDRSLTGSDSIPKVHAWCAADLENCPGGRCAMPPTPVGEMIDLRLGTIAFSEWRVLRGEQLTFTISANPLNTKGELGVFSSSAVCGDSPTVLDFGRPTRTIQLSSVTWENVVVSTPGRYLLCWCDRGYDSDCSLWHRAGIITVAGPPVSTQWLPWVNPSQAFTVSLTGVDLTEGRIAVVTGNGCSDIETRLVSTSAPSSSSGDDATWNLIAPSMEGNFTLCWGEASGSEDQRRLEAQVYNTVVGYFQTIERKDCQITSWATGDCDRPCGGGNLIESRSVIALPAGGGDECPSGTGLVRTKSCNLQACPTAVVSQARTLPVTVRPGQIFQVVLEGDFLAPYEDQIILIPSEEDCGTETEMHSGASCDLPGSSTTNLECGDGTYTVRVQQPGSYRICFCDASISPVSFRNGTQVRCGSASTYGLTPMNGAVFKTVGAVVPRDTDGLFSAIAEEERTSSGTREEGGAREESSQEIVVILSVACGGLMCIVVLCCWRCLIKDYCFKKKEDIKPVKSLDSQDLVEQATREVWNAYARSIVEGVEDEELRKQSQAILDENARALSLRTGRSEGECLSQPEPEPSDPNSSNFSTSGSASTSRLTTPEDLVARGTTPPIRGTTPPTGRKGTPTRNTTPTTPKSRRNSTGGSRACTPPTPKSHPSFFHESLPPLGAPKTPPPQGGSFLDMPLLGVSSGQPSVLGQTGQSDDGQRRASAEFNNEAFKRSGSSWNSSYDSSLYRTRSSSCSSESSHSSSPRSRSEASNKDALMAPRGKPSPFMKLQPLELAPRPPDATLVKPGTPPPLVSQTSEALELETAPNPTSPLDNSSLSSSTARPPGTEFPQPPSLIPSAPEGPPQPPPEGLLDIMNLKTSLMGQLPSMPPPPPPIRADKIGNNRDVVAPPLRSLPELPSDPPPLLPSVNAVGEATPHESVPVQSFPSKEQEPTHHESLPAQSSPSKPEAPHESLPVQSSPAKAKDLAANQGASKGWGLSSLFGGARLPWSGSRKESRSAKVSAMPPPAPSAQPIGTLMQDLDNNKMNQSSPPPKTIEALQSSLPPQTIEVQSHEAIRSSKADHPEMPSSQSPEAQDTDCSRIDSAHRDVMRDSEVSSASCLPTQKPENRAETDLRDTALAEKTSSKLQTPADTRSEARNFIASLRKSPSSSRSKVSPLVTPAAKEINVSPKVPSSALSTKGEAPEVVASGVEATPALNDSLNSETAIPKGALTSMEEIGSACEVAPLQQTAPLAVTSEPEPIASLAMVSETPSSRVGVKASRPQSALQGRYIPGANSDRASSVASSRQRKRPQQLDQLDDVDDTESCVGSEYQLRYTGREETSREGVRAEVLEAQERIRKEWHDKLAGETDWNQVPNPKATLGRPHASTRDKYRPSNASNGRGARSTATSSQASSATSSPRHQSERGPGMPGPPLPGGFAPGPSLHGMPAPGSSQVASGSTMPGPPLFAAPKGGPGRGPTLAPGPPLTGGPNSRGPGRALPAWALK